MPKNEQDPAGSTQQFRAFANRGDSASSGPNTGLIIGGGVVLLVVIVVIALLVI
ncbi:MULTISPECIES: hypothetical protein [Actinoallomurus]|uniref:hypothetical protein n=1 Tax=Actinoallomurus TaxID=667113 RepID=UPI002093BDE4|nr:MULTISPECIES: hypothetical protein [Actinoallomurus]MCO5970314.1 hypothetical protein [Actinoallomurus soli]MCO5998548.1 hypothetical protein [Actinoallomurus rhizosphaericola]